MTNQKKHVLNILQESVDHLLLVEEFVTVGIKYFIKVYSFIDHGGFAVFLVSGGLGDRVCHHPAPLLVFFAYKGGTMDRAGFGLVTEVVVDAVDRTLKNLLLHLTPS